MDQTNHDSVEKEDCSVKETSLDDSDNTFLQVPVGKEDKSTPISRLRVKHKEAKSKRFSYRRKSAKWFMRTHSNDFGIDESSRSRSRNGSDASKQSNGSDASQQANSERQLVRKNSISHLLVKRGRNIRKRMSAIRITDSGCSEEDTGRDGYVLTAEQKLRIFTLKELLETEEDYTKLLQFIVEVIIPTLQGCANDNSFVSVTERTVPNMFSNIKDIHKLHVKFISELQQATHPFPYYKNCIGNIFLKYRNEFASYARFCANFTTGQRISYELEADPELLKMIEEWRKSVASKTRKFLHLEEFIIAPVQRICKYPLLLKELAKFTTENHPDYKDVIEAKEMMSEVTMSVNESERKAIAVKAMRDLEDSCDSWERSGKLSKHGFLTKQGGTFKTWYTRWFTLRGYTMCYYNEPTDTEPLGVLDLTSYKRLEEDASHTLRPYSFGVQTSDRMYYMYCISEKEKQEWITILKWKFSCIDRSRRQAHRPLETVIFASLSSFLNPKNQNADFEGNASKKIGGRAPPRRSKSVITSPFRRFRGDRGRIQSSNT